MKIKMQLISNNHSFHLRNLKQSSLYSNKYIHQRCTVLINVIQAKKKYHHTFPKVFKRNAPCVQSTIMFVFIILNTRQLFR